MRRFVQKYGRREAWPGWVLLLVVAANALHGVINAVGDVEFIAAQADWVRVAFDTVVLNSFFAAGALLVGLLWLIFVGSRAPIVLTLRAPEVAGVEATVNEWADHGSLLPFNTALEIRRGSLKPNGQHDIHAVIKVTNQHPKAGAIRNCTARLLAVRSRESTYDGGSVMQPVEHLHPVYLQWSKSDGGKSSHSFATDATVDVATIEEWSARTYQIVTAELELRQTYRLEVLKDYELTIEIADDTGHVRTVKGELQWWGNITTPPTVWWKKSTPLPGQIAEAVSAMEAASTAAEKRSIVEKYLS